MERKLGAIAELSLLQIAREPVIPPAMANPCVPRPRARRFSSRAEIVLLLLVLALLFGFRLGGYPLGNPDEGRNAEIAREMRVSNDWVTPRLNGVNYFEKPPLVYWLVAGCQAMFGASEWSLRAVPWCFTLGGAALAYWAARSLYGHAAGIAAALVLASSLLYWLAGRVLFLDMAVSVLMSATLFCFIIGIGRPPGSERRRLFYGLYISAALATLAKGMIGFLVTGAVIFLWLLLFNQWRRLRPFYLWQGIAWFLAIAGPWHVLAALRNESWLQRYIVNEHGQRFFTEAGHRPGPWWYFLPIVLGGLFPWTGFLLPALKSALRGGWVQRERHATAWFFVVWAGFVFLFFSMSQSKLPAYVLPVLPPLAVLIGTWLARNARTGLRGFRLGCALFATMCVLLAIALVVGLGGHGASIMDTAQATVLRPFAFTLAAGCVVSSVAVPLLARVSRDWALSGIAATAVFVFAILAWTAPLIHRPGTVDLARFVAARSEPTDRVLHYHEFFHDFTYYANRVVDVVGFKGELELEEDAVARASGRFIDDAEFRRSWNGPAHLYVVARKKDVFTDPSAPAVGPALFEDPSFHYHIAAETRDHVLFTNWSSEQTRLSQKPRITAR